MQNFKIFTASAFIMLLFVSCNSSPKNGNSGCQGGETSSPPLNHIVEAESMNLRRYSVDTDGNHTYIKLTDSTGIAQFDFPLPSGKYDIDVHYLAESIGQNAYILYIDNNQIVAWLGKERDDQWHMLGEQSWHIPKNIKINKGDEIKIEALSENGSLVILDYIEFIESSRSSSPTKQNLSTIYPEEYSKAIKNPLKGFRPKIIYSNKDRLDHEYCTLVKMYFRWNQLENQASDGVDKINAFCNEKWSGIEERNVKFIPRVELQRPGAESGWPSDMTTGDFTSDQFKHRVVALIKKLGQAWDNDPRVAYIEMGIIGEWGEMEWPDTKDEIKEAIAAQFAASFQNKLVMIRWPNTYNDDIYNFGYYWDSFAHHDQEYCGLHINNTAPRWKTAVVGGEAAYNWGNVQIQPGESPDVSLTDPVHRDYIIDRIRKLHANHLGWISRYNQNDPDVRAGAEIVQKAMGYRFVITEFTYPRRIDTDNSFTLSFKVKNTGSSPFYYNWPVEVSLLNPKTKQVVWKQQCTHIDIRNWMPGDKWDYDTNEYKIPAETYLANQTLLLSEEVPSGEYILALSILDPGGNLPSARFAIKNYYNGGRHPIGKVGVNQSINSFELSEFDDIQSDTSIYYSSAVKQNKM